MVTHFCAAAAGLTWAGLEWIFRGKPSVLGACSGVVAGSGLHYARLGLRDAPCRP